MKMRHKKVERFFALLKQAEDIAAELDLHLSNGGFVDSNLASIRFDVENQYEKVGA